MNLKALAKYAEHYSEREARGLTGWGETFGHVLVIPAYDEAEALTRSLAQLPSGPLGNILIILVINAPEDASPQSQERTREVLVELRRQLGPGKAVGVSQTMELMDHPLGRVLAIDRCSPSRLLPKGQGVGLARKIGCDAALSLHSRGKILSSWIHTTDADVLLPADYFFRAAPQGRRRPAAALLYPSWHQCETDPVLADAMRRYEIFLRYYVLGLAHAGSPYAFQTLGSTLAIDSLAYAQVRGFPRRAAGEDFYILGKLAKVGQVLRLAGEPIQISGRFSHRVPFGTGAALGQIAPALSAGQQYRIYSPEVFRYLRAWSKAFARFAQAGGEKTPRGALEEAASSEPTVSFDLLLSTARDLGILEAMRRSAVIASDAFTLSRHLHTWFDAFRTLKLIHYLTQQAFPRRELLQAIRSADFIDPASSATSSLETLRVNLAVAEARLPAAMGLASMKRLYPAGLVPEAPGVSPAISAAS